MSFKLWPHQTDAIVAAAHAICTDRKAGLWEIPTGGGKTHAFLTVAKGLGWPTLVLVHRDELVRQTVNAASDLCPGCRIGVIQGNRQEWRDRDLVVASVQSLRGDRLDEIPANQFGLVVADECHHVPAPSWSAILWHFKPWFLLGVTATPDRLDGQGLVDWFGPEPLYAYPLQQAIQDRILVRIRQFAINTEISLDDIELRAGDFAAGELGKAVATAARNRVIVEAYLMHAQDRKTIVFAVDLEHVQQLTSAFAASGVSVGYVTGEMPIHERRRTLTDFGAGVYRVLVNCEVCTEGYDERSVSCVIMARPTQSRALYQQCVGRGLRICPEENKRDCLVLDITDNCRRHKLISIFDLFGACRLRDAHGGDVLDAIINEKARVAYRYRPCRCSPTVASPTVRWAVEEVPPWPELPTLVGYSPTQTWHTQPATSEQLGYLERAGICISRSLTKGEAHHLIAQCKRFERLYQTPATFNQRCFLKNRGEWYAGISKAEATALIGQIKNQENNSLLCR